VITITWPNKSTHAWQPYTREVDPFSVSISSISEGQLTTGNNPVGSSPSPSYFFLQNTHIKTLLWVVILWSFLLSSI